MASMHSARSCRVRTVVVGAGASVATLLAVSALAVADKPAGKTTPEPNGKNNVKVTCTINLIAVKPPRTITAENFGTLDCSPRLGKGVQHDSSVVTPTGQFMGSFTGPYQQFFNTGTLFGHFTISYQTNPQTLAVTYNGTIQVEGGTGKYKNFRGSGTLQGGSPDAIRSTITELVTLTHK
jgi:hypothetical protein